MRSFTLAQLLMKTPDAEVVLKVSNDWVEVCGVTATGQHRNAVTFEVVNPALPGVIVVVPDLNWHRADEPIPAPGDYLASDGIRTWVMRRESIGPVVTTEELAYLLRASKGCRSWK